MNSSDRTDRYCIIGAGASGLAVAKNFVQRGIPFDCLEREPDIGGLWNFATESGIVYETTHLVSSISSTGFDDLPMLDEDYPEYPSHERVLGYFRDFVAHLRAGPAYRVRQGHDARSRRAATSCGRWRSPARPSRASIAAWWWRAAITMRRACRPIRARSPARPCIRAATRAPSRCATGACWWWAAATPRPTSCRTPCTAARKVFLSIRRGYWFVPKFIMGFPTGDVLSTVEMMPLPRLVKRWLFQGSLWLLQGPPSRYRMPDPDYAIDQAHPTMTDEIPRLVAHGKLTVKPDIASLRRQPRAVQGRHRRGRSTPSCSPPATGRSFPSWTRA